MKPLVALCSGLLFGVGLMVSAMGSPARVLAFLDVYGSDWDPSLALVLITAVAVSGVGFVVARRRSAPLFAADFSGPASRVVDRKLLAGAALFGVGWGLVGYCPGPALAAWALGAPSAPVFLAAMLVGMGSHAGLARLWTRQART